MKWGKPEVVCLIGSTRFRREYEEENRRLTLEGKIVLTCGVWVHHEADAHDNIEQKEMLDDLHRWKIDWSDRVHVIDVGGYIGESTRQEIAYAEIAGKPVTFMSEMRDGRLMGDEGS